MNYSYKEAFEELQLIVSEIESGAIHVDELTEKIQRAAQLIAVCKAKLSTSEEEVEKLLSKLTENGIENSEKASSEEEE